MDQDRDTTDPRRRRTATRYTGAVQHSHLPDLDLRPGGPGAPGRLRLRAQRQPDARGARAGHRRARGRRARAGLRLRHGGHLLGAAALLARRPPRRQRRHLRRHLPRADHALRALGARRDLRRHAPTPSACARRSRRPRAPSSSRRPSNPLLRSPTCAAMATLARERGLLAIIDNTFMTPVSAAAARARLRHRRAQRHQVPRRPQRPDRRPGRDARRRAGPAR